MKLAERLRLLRDKYEGTGRAGGGIIPSDAIAVMHHATEELRRSGILEGVPKVGARAPDFALENTKGEVVRSDALLAKGAVVLSFYRGRW